MSAPTPPLPRPPSAPWHLQEVIEIQSDTLPPSNGSASSLQLIHFEQDDVDDVVFISNTPRVKEIAVQTVSSVDEEKEAYRKKVVKFQAKLQEVAISTKHVHTLIDRITTDHVKTCTELELLKRENLNLALHCKAMKLVQDELKNELAERSEELKKVKEENVKLNKNLRSITAMKMLAESLSIQRKKSVSYHLIFLNLKLWITLILLT